MPKIEIKKYMDKSDKFKVAVVGRNKEESDDVIVHDNDLRPGGCLRR